MKALLLFLLLFFLPFASAQSLDNYHQYGSLEMEQILTANIDTKTSGSSPSLEYLTAEIKITPKDSDRQSSLSQKETADPSASITQGEPTIFTWKTLSSQYTYTIKTKVKTQNILYKIPPIPFPLEDKLPEEIEEYTKAAELIDITQDIRDQANEIVGGQTDMYTAVFLLADWTKTNINYDLNTLTAEAALPASWVLRNREGVCDEMTSLFIAMTRSVGIPARFVSGRVYTNLNYTFGNHGWAEVYFPNIGWVPYDPTFGHYGWIDPTHIALSTTVDAGEPAVSFTWKASKIEVTPQELVLDTVITSTSDPLSPIYELSIESLESTVGPGSYVPIKVITKTPYNKFTSTTLTLTKAPEVMGSNVKSVLLEPNAEKETYWLVKIPDEAEEGFIYTTKVTVKDLFGSEAETEITYALGEKIVTKEEAEVTIRSLEKPTKSYSEELSLSCKSSKKYYFKDESGEVSCSLKNTGNKPLSNIQVCFSNCESVSLGISESKEVKFTLDPESLPLQRKVTASVNEIDVEDSLSFSIFDSASVKVLSIESPKQAPYSSIIKINLTLDSPTKVKDVVLTIGDKRVATLTELEGSHFLAFEISASEVPYSKKLYINYKDERGNSLSTEQEITTTVTGLPFYAKIYSFFRGLIN